MYFNKNKTIITTIMSSWRQKKKKINKRKTWLFYRNTTIRKQKTKR